MTIDEIEKLKGQSLPKFANFAKDQLPMPGVKKRLDDIVNREITILDYKIRRSTQKDGTDCLQLQFLLDDIVCIVFTGSKVLMRQIKDFGDKVPFVCTISHVERYFTFS